MAVVAYNVPNLNIAPSDNYNVPQAYDYVRTEGDMSQIGMDRDIQSAPLHIPAIEKGLIVFPRAANHGFWKSALTPPEGSDVTDTDAVIMTVKTVGLLKTDIGADSAEHAKIISDLQEALDPVREISMQSVTNDERMQAHLASIMARLPRAAAVVSAALTQLAIIDDRFFAWARENLGMSEATVRDDIVITPNLVIDMNYANWLVASSLWRDRSDSEMQSWKVVDVSKLLAAANLDESTYQNELLSDMYNVVRADLSVQAFKCPARIAELFEGILTLANVNVKVSYGEDETKIRGNFTIKPGKLNMLRELTMYVLSLRQIMGVSPDRAREFAMTRMLIVRHGLIHDTKEVSLMEPKIPFVQSMDDVVNWLGMCRKPETFYMCMMTAVISFLKSGHHASAANLDNTLEKLLGAISIPTNRESSRNLLMTSVYNGTHPASMRLLMAYCLHRVQTKKLSGAISYRLATSPPLAMGFNNLEIFMDALNAAEFFAMMGRTAEYTTFKDHMRTIRSSMWYVAPYSLYLFGKTKPDPLYAKGEAAKLAAYAAAISSALPNSTLIYSPALRKMANQASVNSISAQLMIEGYVDAFRQFFKRTVARTLTEKKKIRGREGVE